MVEQEAVNFEVAGSSPVPGANYSSWKAPSRRFFVLARPPRRASREENTNLAPFSLE